MSVVKLTAEDIKKSEFQKELFVMIRTLDVIEKMYNLDKISKEEYNKQVEKLLTYYERLKKNIHEFELNTFVKMYGLDECRWAIDRINTGIPKDENDNKALFIKLTSKYHEMSDCLFLHNSKPMVSVFKPILEDLILLVRRALPFLGIDFTGLVDLEKSLAMLNSKSLSDLLLQTEFNELMASVDLSQKAFYRSTLSS
eukprot:TRINITY_DN2125_c0_g1_i1.p1 TRINITY_DN2125_c0_g1~~TRINITY_DN2125_c0_g1_i1.p1  ORF type:complete len:198 (+),score=61.55 TRINITY_DN2125_c0_g1_i1:146-739(+)